MDGRGFTRRQMLAGGAALLGAGILAGCTPGGSVAPTASATPRKGGVLRVAASGGGAQDSLDPNLAFDDPAIVRVGALYETLTKIDLDYKLQNVLAESFEPNADGTAWTMRIRDGVTFHNGKKLTADDILASFQRVFDKQNPSTSAATLSWLNLKDSVKVDERTVKFALDHAVGPFPLLISGVSIIPVDFDPTSGIGTGPFRLKSFTAGDRAVFVRNDNYWQRGAYLDQLVAIDFPDPTAGVNALLGGQVDVLSSVPTSQTKVVTGGGAQLLLGDKGRPLMFDMRDDVAPFNDVRVRQAFRLMVDRKQMVEQAVGGYGVIGNDMYSPWDAAYPGGLAQREQDIDKAKSLLKQAGAEGLTVNLPTAPMVSGLVEMCLVFKEQAKAAGVTVNVVQQDPGTFQSQSFGNANFIPDFQSNLPYLQLSGLYQLPGAPFNATHTNDPEYLKLFDEALQTLDDKKRNEIEGRMYQIDYDRGPFVLPVHAKTVDAYSTKVGGFVNNAKVWQPMNNADFRNVYLMS